MLCPGFKVTGQEASAMENWVADEEAPEIVTLCLFSFVMVTLCVALTEPTDSLPKFTREGLAFTFACATVAKASRTIMAAAAA
jgi:hypothetical protein